MNLVRGMSQLERSSQVAGIVLVQLEFWRKSTKCEELASGVGSKVEKLGDDRVSFNTSILRLGSYTCMYMVAKENYNTYPRRVPSYKIKRNMLQQ